MRRVKFTVLVALMFASMSFNTFAMENYSADFLHRSPCNEEKHEDRSLDYRWTWLNDENCAQFLMSEGVRKSKIEYQYNLGMLSGWNKAREAYSGKWSQSPDGIWSFKFDDCTIPVGVTKIDNVIYAFNTYGELKEGYEYYDGLITGTDGLVTSDDPAFLEWLGTQYLPECTSHE